MKDMSTFGRSAASAALRSSLMAMPMTTSILSTRVQLKINKSENPAFVGVRGIFVVLLYKNPAFLCERGIFVVLLYENPAFLALRKSRVSWVARDFRSFAVRKSRVSGRARDFRSRVQGVRG